MRHNTRDLVSRFKTSGMTQQRFCARHSVPLSTLQYYLKRERQKNSVPVARPAFIPLTPPVADAPMTIMIIRGRFSKEQLSQLIHAEGRV